MIEHPKYQTLEGKYPEILPGVSIIIQKAKIALRFNQIRLTNAEWTKLSKAKELCEISIIENWDKQDSDEFKTLCSIYFDLAILLPLPGEKIDAIYELIKLIALGFLGESWHLVRQHLRSLRIENLFEITNEKWNKRLLITAFRGLIHLIKKDNWQELQEAIGYINVLRKEQTEFESNYLDEQESGEKKSAASELIALYHFAKTIDLLSDYLIDGQPNNASEQVKFHMEYASRYADDAGNFSFKLLIQYFEQFAQKQIRNTLWHITRGINSRVTRFNEFIVHRDHKPVMEMLYPQREAILEGGLLNDAFDAVVVNLPTSSGKTLIAEYRLLKALNQFADQGGWVAYVVPTRALVNQVTIQLQKDLSTINIRIEKLSGAIELDGFEETLLQADTQTSQFDVLVTTYEKLNLLIRQGMGASDARPLVLAIIDEAHNIEEEDRGIGLELLITTIKKDCRRANFLLMTPDLVNSKEICNWLSSDRGTPISLGLHWWQPNERIIGALMAEGERREYNFKLKTLITQKGTFAIDEDIELCKLENAPIAMSHLYGKGGVKKKFASIISAKLNEEVLIVLAKSPSDTFDIAEDIYNIIGDKDHIDDEIELVIKYVEAELGRDFPLSKYLRKRIGLHSSAIPEDIRFLIEDLMSTEKLKVLVATTTIAQGMNFPVSAVVMASYSYPYKKMPYRDFWNMVGRVGRAGQKNTGFVGVVLKNDDDLTAVASYVSRVASDLKSQMVSMIQNALDDPEIRFEQWLFREPKWSSLLQYISHLYSQTDSLQNFIAELEINLQSTLGFRQLNENQKNYLRRNIREYIGNVDRGHASLSDQTGFSTISIRNMIGALSGAGITSADWNRNQLFSHQNVSLQKLVGIMLKTPEVRKQIEDINKSERVLDHSIISRIITDWVNGSSIEALASAYFVGENSNKSIESCAQILYRNVANAATWGLAAIQKMPTSGLNWDKLSDVEKKQLANLPAMIHYGVNTDEAVLLRKNNVPRSVATRLGELYRATHGENIFNQSSNAIKTWLSGITDQNWDQVRPNNVRMTGRDYKNIWEKLSGV
jgi:replicative superfamily II helicase